MRGEILYLKIISVLVKGDVAEHYVSLDFHYIYPILNDRQDVKLLRLSVSSQQVKGGHLVY